jgi:hypothetical protein
MIFQKKTINAIVLCLIVPFILSGCAKGNQSSPTTLVASCSLDGIAGATQTSPMAFSLPLAPPDTIVRGWIANALAGESPDEITIVIANSMGKIYSYEKEKPVSRPDVATAYKKPGMSNSGFEILMDNVTEPGNYTVTIQGKFKDDNLVCSRIFTLTATN